MKTRNFFWGALLIAIGTLLMLNNFYDLEIFRISKLWPLIILIPGLIFEFEYFSTKRNPGLLVPGGILSTIGLLFLFETFTNFHYAAYTWPIYPLALAIGLFQLYLYYGRPSGLLVPVFIFGGVSITAFVIMFLQNFYPWVNSSIVFPVLLILLGLFVLTKNFIRK